MRTRAAALAVATVSCLGVTACGGDSTADFCALDDRLNLADLDDLGEMQAVLDEAVDVAPDEIRDDVETVRDTLDEVVSRLEAQGVDKLSEATPEQQEGVADLNTAEFQGATENIQRFGQENCESSS